MTVPFWVVELAACFWERAGEDEAFPRELRRPIARALPVAVVSLPGLRVSSIDAWLERRGVACDIRVGDRLLRACLVARHGHGVIFLDGGDSAEEQRFSLAHETAHFLRHYEEPRLRAAGRLGDRVLEVLDGDRPPEAAERVDSLLAHMRIGAYIHMMERDAGSARGVGASEQEADLLAFEMLAPAEAIEREGARNRLDITHVLCGSYGMPVGAAERYAQRLAPRRRATVAHRLGLV